MAIRRYITEDEIRKHFLNIEIYETWKNYERIANENKMENPLHYEDIRHSFKCYYYGGIYVPDGIFKIGVGSIFLRFFPRDFLKEYSNAIVAPIFGYEKQLRNRIVHTAYWSKELRKSKKIDVNFFNLIWNKTFDKEEQKEIIQIRRLSTRGLLFLTRLSSYFAKYHQFLLKVRDWEEEMLKKGRVY